MGYPLDIFKGTAEYYERYRPRYPQDLFDDVVSKFSLDGQGILLDLGCGTGQIALPLAGFFESVRAWDPDPDMLHLGRQKAAAAHITSVIFEQNSSRDLGKLRVPLRLATMGQSFHWMDKQTVLEQLHSALQANGGVVIVSGSIEVKQDTLAAEKSRLVQAIVARYLGERRRAGNTFYKHAEERYHALLTRAGFNDIDEKFYDCQTVYSIDEVVGHTFSTSWASKEQLGERAQDFEADLRRELEQLLPEGGHFTETIQFSCFTASKE